MGATKPPTVEVGTVVFLVSGAGGHPPARWRVTRVYRRWVDIEHAQRLFVTPPLSPQRIRRDIVERAIAAGWKVDDA